MTSHEIANLHVGQTVITKTFRAAGKISRVWVIADGQRVIELDMIEGPAKGSKTWVGPTQIEKVLVDA